jgi:uncharacterized protein involved in cysteine biosynthesis
MVRSIRAFWFGLTLPIRAAGVIVRSPALLAASLVPWLLSVALDAWLIHRLQASLSDWVHGYVPGGWEWAARVIVWVVVFVAGVLAFSFIAGIAALPFNDWLAELTEPRAMPPLPPTGHKSWLARGQLLLIDLLKTLCALFLSIVALVLSWLPGVNVLGIGMAFLLVTFQFLSYPQTRRKEGLVAGFRFLFAHFWACLGFGMSFSFLFALPLVSSLALPLAVVAGTLLYAAAVAEPPRAPGATPLPAPAARA